jgi:hypothetical protein
MVSILSPGRFTSSAQTKSWCVPFNFSPTWFSWTFLMAYSSGYKASPCFRPFWIGKSDRCLPIRTLPYVSFKHILISLTSSMGTPNSMRILYNTSWSLRIADVLSHCTPIFSPVSDECKRSDQ